MSKFELELTFLDQPGRPKERRPVSPGRDPEAAARSRRGYYASRRQLEGVVQVKVIEIADAEKLYCVYDKVGHAIKRFLPFNEAKAYSDSVEDSTFWEEK